MPYTKEQIIENSVWVLPSHSYDINITNQTTGETRMDSAPTYSSGSGTIIKGENAHWVLTNMHVVEQDGALSAFSLPAEQEMGGGTRHYYWMARGNEIFLAESAVFAGSSAECSGLTRVEDAAILRVLPKDEAKEVLQAYQRANTVSLGVRDREEIFAFSPDFNTRNKVFNPLISGLSFSAVEKDTLENLRDTWRLAELFDAALAHYPEEFEGIAVEDLVTKEIEAGSSLVSAGFSGEYYEAARNVNDTLAAAGRSRVPLEPNMSELTYIHTRDYPNVKSGAPYVYSASSDPSAVAPGSSGSMSYLMLDEDAYLPQGLQYSRDHPDNPGAKPIGYASGLENIRGTIISVDTLHGERKSLTERFPVSSAEYDYCDSYKSGFAPDPELKMAQAQATELLSR